MTSPKVRLASTDDAEQIAVAHVRSWQVAYDGVIPADTLDGFDVAERTQRWKSNLDGTNDPTPRDPPVTTVVEIDDQVIGFASVGPWRDEQDPSIAELWALYVHPDCWRSGAGRVLMADVLSRVRSLGASRARLWVLEANTVGRSSYEKVGWSPIPESLAEPQILTIGGVEIPEVIYQIAL